MNAKVLSFEGHSLTKALSEVKESPRRHISFLDEWVPRHARIPSKVENLNVSATYRAMENCFELHISAKDEEEVKEIMDLLNQLKKRKPIIE